MERVSPLNGVALREVARIGLLARGAEPHAPNLFGLHELRCQVRVMFRAILGVLRFLVFPKGSICSHLIENSC